jgi:hypothetical protein
VTVLEYRFMMTFPSAGIARTTGVVEMDRDPDPVVREAKERSMARRKGGWRLEVSEGIPTFELTYERGWILLMSDKGGKDHQDRLERAFEGE